MATAYSKAISPTCLRFEVAVTSLKPPFPIAEFDRLVAVRCANPTMTRADIEAWQMMPWGV
jgi:hypothetical protein